MHKWDERFHALVAKNMLDHPLIPALYNDPVLDYDYTRWYANHVWLHKQPVPLWLIAITYKIFGVSEFATRIPSLIFSLLAIFITYLLGRKLFNQKVGLLAAFFMSINGLVIELGAGRVATDHYDVLFMVFIELAIVSAFYNATKRKVIFSILSGCFLALAVLTKWLPCLIVLPIHYVFLTNTYWTKREKFKQLSISLITCVLLSLPWQLYILHNFPLEAKWEYYYNWLHISTGLEGQGDSWFYFLGQIRINYSEIIYGPLLYLCYIVIKSKFRNLNFLALFIWIFLPLLFFSIAKTKMQGYILFICPALFLITADFFFQLKDKWINQFNKQWMKITGVLFLIAIIFLPLRYCFERTHFGFNEAESDAYCEIYKSFRGKFSQRSIVLNVKEPVDFRFYNNCIAYSNVEISKIKMACLIKKGYSFFYLDEKNKIIEISD